MDLLEQTSNQHPTAVNIFHVPQKRRLMICLLLTLATIALYNPVTRAPFLNFDDDVYVSENLHVRAGLTWSTAVWAFRTPEASNWHPITWFSHALDCQMFGLNPTGPHTINVLIHAANVVLLFLILESATGFAWRSLAVAALFALHPINVESVAWISERKNVLSMFFFLLALAAYSWYARRPGIGRYLVVTSAYVLGLMTKPQVITFPFALLLLDYWPLHRLAVRQSVDTESNSKAENEAPRGSWWSLIAEKLPWVALSALSAIVTMQAQVNARWEKLPLSIRLGNAAISYVKYLEKAFWPLHLAPMYPYAQSEVRVSTIAFSVFAIFGFSTLAVVFRQRRPFFVGWFWFLGTLVPMIGLVQVGAQSMADRYAYIPLLGIFVVVVWGAAELIEAVRIPAFVPAAVTAVILLALGFALHRQVDFWSDNLTLWTHTLEITGPNFAAEDNLASELLVEGREQEALPHLLRARALRPDDAATTLNLANYERMHGHYQAALEGFAKVLQFTKDPFFVSTACLDSGYTHFALKEYGKAKGDFETSLAARPANAAAYSALGLLAQKAGEIAEAAQDYQHSVAFEPTPVAYLLLAQALELQGQTDAARAARLQAARQAAGSTRSLEAQTAAVKQLLEE